ncbi:MAG: hypothetical protein WAT67_13625 [Candidatus Contendobacter sp.]
MDFNGLASYAHSINHEIRDDCSRCQYLTVEQRLDLAKAILRLIEEQYPQEDHDGQKQALALAIMGITSVSYPSTLFGFGK